MIDTTDLLKSYQNIWWSPRPGTAYVADMSGRLVGPGLKAAELPGAFNLYWLLTRLPEPTKVSFVPHLRANIGLLADLCRISRQNVLGYPIYEWAVVYKPREFIEWFTSNHHHVQRRTGLGPTLKTVEAFLQQLQIALATQP